MAHFVGDGVGQRDPAILVDAAALVRVAHPPDVRHPQRVARDVLAGADVLPRDQDGDVVVVRVGVVAGIQGFLPLAKVPKRGVRVDGYVEERLRSGVVDEDNFHHDNVYVVSDTGVHV